ncbi:MAG: sugar ABC transporter permease [Clostridia bacterium]|nr:sugar ABC transporter permease [Clostridia bacterium]
MDVLSRLSYTTQKRILMFSFLLLPLALLITFSYLPLLNMFNYSLHRWDGLSKTMQYIGLDNYKALFTNKEYFSVFGVSLYYLVGSFVQVVLALYFATILSFKVVGKNLFKGVLFFPYLLNGVAIAFIFIYFFQPDGTLDSFLKLIGLDNLITKWLGNRNVINVSLTGTSIWRYMGYSFVMYLGAIQSVPGELYEAAEIEGANKWHLFRYIIFPSVIRIIELNMILSISGAISVFEIPYIMTGGGNGSKTFVIQTVDLAFKNKKYGLASAMGIVLLLIVIVVTLLQKRIFREKED